MSDLLRLERVTLDRGGRTLFENIDLSVGPGEALHVLGPNGAGKSSLLRLAAGLLRAKAGRIVRSQAALADDHLALDRDLSLKSALSFWGGTVDAAMDALGLTRLASVPVRLLSSGQRKRANLARVAASGAPLWLLDEPLNALDSEGAASLERLLAAHRGSGGAVVIASHSTPWDDWRTLELGA